VPLDLHQCCGTPSGVWKLAAETTDPNAQEILINTAQNWERLASKAGRRPRRIAGAVPQVNFGGWTCCNASSHTGCCGERRLLAGGNDKAAERKRDFAACFDSAVDVIGPEARWRQR
jgi:hypothetical protein